MRERLRGLPRSLTVDWGAHTVLLVHGSPDEPLTGYVFPDSVVPTLPEHVDFCFCGNTHRGFVADGREPHFVNVGSAGMPRDRGDRAQLAIVDSDPWRVELLSVALDVDTIRTRYAAVHPRVLALLDRRSPVSQGKRVLVTGVAGANVGEQVCKALRLAGQEHVVVAANIDPSLVPHPLVDEVVALPRADSDDYVARVVELGRTWGLDAVIPGSEGELLRLVRERSQVEAAGLRLLANNAEVVGLCSDKAALTEWLNDRGHPAPETTTVTAWEDLQRVRTFPVVTKPRAGGGGSSQVWLAQNRSELEAVAAFMVADLGGFVAQEYVGTGDAEYTVGVLSDPCGRVVDSIALRRDLGSALSRRHAVTNRTRRADLGPSLVVSSGVSQGAVVAPGEVSAACEAIAAAIGSTGPLNIQLRWVDGEPYVFEINPRFSGTTSIRAWFGFNEPAWLLAERPGGELEPPQRLGYRTGKVVRGLAEYLV